MIIPEWIGALHVVSLTTWDDDFGGVRLRLLCRDRIGRRLCVEQRIEREYFSAALNRTRQWMLRKVEEVAGSIKESGSGDVRGRHSRV